MVAVFTGNGLGLFNTTQGGGNGRVGQGQDGQFVNLATGNLVLQSQDEQLLFRGLPVAQLRTYNSLGSWAQMGSDGWLTGFERRVELVSGVFNQGANSKPPYGSVEDFAQQLRSGGIDPATINPVRIVERDGKIFTLDNGRLYSFKRAGVNIPYQKLDALPKRELFKFTTTNDGASILIRKGK